MTRRIPLFAAICATAIATGAHAASISISPIRLDVVYPGNSARLTVKNNGVSAVTAQVRVFQWTSQNGRDSFTETRDVVVSPPIATIRPGGDFNVRLLRVSGAPVRGVENYRVVVDEVPDRNRVRNVGITVAIRYALPLFVYAPDATKPKVTWSVKMIGGKRALVATNQGDTHLRIANLTIGNLKLGRGLNGYVLGHSARIFELPRNASPSGKLTAETDQGRLNANITR